jgi:hypothetical protein
MLKQILKLTFALFISASAMGQQLGSIAGKLTDKDFNDEPLPFANILIKGTTKGTTSDYDGLYEIAGLEPGNYTVVFSFVGYETQELEVTVEAGKVTTVNVPMGTSAASLDEVVITTTSRKESEVALLLDQKNAVEIKESIGAEQLSRLGVSDASAATTKISGVSKSDGAGQIYVRGLGDRYLTTTLNGLPVPQTTSTKRTSTWSCSQQGSFRTYRSVRPLLLTILRIKPQETSTLPLKKLPPDRIMNLVYEAVSIQMLPMFTMILR